MKSEKIMMSLTMLLLFLGLAAYFGIYTFRSLNDPFSTALCYTHTVDESVEATGWVIREETVLPRQNGVVDILPEEGEKVAAGEVVAVVYQDASALERKTQIRQLELELEQLEYSLRQDSGRGDAAKLDQDILTALVELRGETAVGDLSGLEENAMRLKSMVFHRSYTYSSSTESVESITAMIHTVSGQLQELEKQSQSVSRRVKAPAAGVYSALVDGYEEVLTVESLDSLNVSVLEQVQAVSVSEEGQAGRLITSSRWYFAAAVESSLVEELREGDSLTLRFSQERTGQVSARVERLGEEENGKTLVILSSDRQLSDVTLLRRQTVELVLDSTTACVFPRVLSGWRSRPSPTRTPGRRRQRGKAWSMPS